MIAEKIKYKKTGLDWMPEIPEHWEIIRLKFLDKLIMGQSPSSNSYNDEKKGYAFLQGNAEFGELFPTERIYTTEPIKIAPKGSILYSVRAPIGAVNKADKDYCIGRGLCSIVPVKTHPDFLYYVALLAKQELNSLGKGSTFTAITVADVSNISIPVPPYSEQEVIANYLNIESAKINRFIEKKQRLIELLKEKRQSIITNAVTKGLNHKSKLKSSGIEWLGDVPDNWLKLRLKYLTKVKKGKSPSQFSDDTTLYPYLSMDYLRGKFEVIQYVQNNENLVFVGDNEILILWDGANAGEVFKSKEGYLSSTMAIIEPEKTFFDKDFFFYFLKGIETSLKQLSTGTTIPHLNQNILFNTNFFFPTKDIQKQIVDYIKKETATIDKAIAKAEREIELMKEYKEAMIAEAVMGKMNLN
jgi:type I restriction enzyme S subunit